MRSLLLFLGLSCLFVSTASAQLDIFPSKPTDEGKPPAYLVHIATDSPAPGKGTFYTDWGSGALVDPEYVLTCSHNIELVHDQIMVTFRNGDQVEAEVFAREPVLDLCILKLKETRFETPIKVSQDVVEARQTVTAWGYPGDGTSKAASFTGKVSPAILQIGNIRGAWFRFSGQAGQGVSGGPVIVGGKLVGVEVGSFPVTGIRAVNTPQVRAILRKLP